jgi:tRNA (guanine-N7-)-methyltransferase
VVKNKLQRFEEMATFSNVIQPSFEEAFHNKSPLKGNWKTKVFSNKNPLVVELGCGKGEYARGLASRFPEKNFIATDIKGARMWVGARAALEEDLKNVRFLRTRIEFINSFFAPGEVDEIWITFPDPQPKVKRTKKRLTSALFLNSYRKFLAPDAKIHLKTDCRFLFEYTKELLLFNGIEAEIATSDLYSEKPSGCESGLLQIQTFYEKLFLSQDVPITYIRFMVPDGLVFSELEDDKVQELLDNYEVQKARFF